MCLKSQTSNLASLITSLPANYLILTSLPTVNIIPLKLPCFTFTTISSMQYDHKKYHAFAFLISLLPLTPSTTTSQSLASHLGLVCMALFSAGSSLTYHLGPFVLNMIITSLPSALPHVAFPKALFSAHYSSSCTLHLSVLLSLPFPATTTFMQMILSSSSLSTHSTLTQAFLTFMALFNTSLPG